MKLKQSLLVLSLVVLGLLFAACGGGGTPATKVKLTVTKTGDGNGTVTSAPAGITATTGNFDFNKGTTVTLTAEPAADSTFAGFTNCAAIAGSANKCTVTLNAATPVTAKFDKKATGGGDPVMGVTITGGDREVKTGTEVALTATVEPSTAAQTVTWESDTPTVASVDATTGVVTAKADGIATITAKSTVDPTKFGTIKLTVSANAPSAAVNSVTILEGDTTVKLGGTKQLNADVDTVGDAADTVTWESDNKAVATVNATTGVVSGITAGTANIKATSTADKTQSDTVVVTVSATAPASATFAVIDGNDDAEQFLTFSNANYPVNSVYTVSADLDLTNDINPTTGSRGNQLVAVRFQNVTVPKGATITSAYIQFRAIDNPTPGAGTPTFTIKGIAADNTTSFVDKEVNGISSRPTTTASVPWTPDPWKGNRATAASRSPDLKTIVQEIVNRPGWAADHALAVVISGTASTTDYRAAQSFEKSGRVAQLIVEYQQ
ncbi:hypothetical protein BH24DEI2_BH24DEI2_06680 [soil metagenome]